MLGTVGGARVCRHGRVGDGCEASSEPLGCRRRPS